MYNFFNTLSEIQSRKYSYVKNLANISRLNEIMKKSLPYTNLDIRLKAIIESEIDYDIS